MFPKKHRLSKSADVKKTTARGRSFFNKYFVIKSVPQNDEKKFTVVVSTKISKKAVERNRIKRIVREELRKNIDNIKTGSYVFLIKPLALKIESKELRSELFKSLTIAKIIKTSSN